MGTDKRPFELVRFAIYDVGRAIDVRALPDGASLRAHPDARPDACRRCRPDTPSSILLPRPVHLDAGSAEAGAFETLSATAKIYTDGTISVEARARAELALEDLSAFASARLARDGADILSVDEWMERAFRRAVDFASPAISDPRPDMGAEKETYLAFCLRACPEGPDAFLAENRETVAALLVGSAEGEALHESQIAAAVAAPFSYRRGDMAIFDIDRCFIVDPEGDYEDILQIAEHANYRLLELRALDRLLDVRLDEAERDLLAYGRGGPRARRKLARAAPRTQFARIQALRFEALFILENLENSSKIIGDYYLGQIYQRLCVIFNTDGWSRSVERRLDVLSSVYDMAKTDAAQRQTFFMEALFIAVCVILPALQIWIAFILA